MVQDGGRARTCKSKRVPGEVEEQADAPRRETTFVRRRSSRGFCVALAFFSLRCTCFLLIVSLGAGRIQLRSGAKFLAAVFHVPKKVWRWCLLILPSL